MDINFFYGYVYADVSHRRSDDQAEGGGRKLFQEEIYTIINKNL